MYAKKQNGFTLIEVLIVITIIGLLGSFVWVSSVQARVAGRDARRLEDVQSLRKALQMHFVSHGSYPVALAETILTGSDTITQELISSESLHAPLVDPLNGNSERCGDEMCAYRYQRNAGGSQYSLRFCIEKKVSDTLRIGCGNTVTP
jgi:prepilin-type N-terminal cleavage/methylation domain-containing protein